MGLRAGLAWPAGLLGLEPLGSGGQRRSELLLAPTVIPESEGVERLELIGAQLRLHGNTLTGLVGAPEALPSGLELRRRELSLGLRHRPPR